MNVPCLTNLYTSPFNDQLTHGPLNGHPAGIELRRQRKLVRQGFIGGIPLADDAFLISRAMVMCFAAIVLPSV